MSDGFIGVQIYAKITTMFFLHSRQQNIFFAQFPRQNKKTTLFKVSPL